MSRVRTPPGLAVGGKRLWKAVHDQYDVGGHQLEILRLACVTLDRADDAAKRIAEDGPLLPDRFDVLRPHPAVAIEKDSRVAFARLVRELALEVDEGPVADVRVPRLVRRS